MKYVIQLINHEDGTRTEPFVVEIKDLVQNLLKSTLPRENLILCVGYVPEENNEMQISGNPLMTIDTFLKANGVVESDYQEIAYV